MDKAIMLDRGERNWLIRTRSMQILGPVSLAKVMELIEKGSLRDEDEITSGNGYWFCIRESELVERYLHQNVPQEFNPISEAKSVLTTKQEPPKRRAAEKIIDESVAPLSAEDLEYPDIEEPITIESLDDETPEIIIPDIEDDSDDEQDDVTLIATNIEIPKVEKRVEVKVELEPPPSFEKEEPLLEIKKSTQSVQQKVTVKKSSRKGKPGMKTITKNDRYLFVLLALVASLIFGIIYYYRTILNKPLPGFETSWLINSAHAQNAILTAPAKKKALIN